MAPPSAGRVRSEPPPRPSDQLIIDRGPFLLASGKFPLPGGGTLATGRYLKYGGNPHTSLLQSVAALYGVPKMTVYPDWDKGPLSGLY